MAARGGVEHTTLRLRVIASTNAPPCPTSYESLFIKIAQHKITPLILGVIYRPPCKSPLTFNEEFVELVSELTVNKKEVILLGDFNLDLLKHTCSTHPQTNNFLDVLISHH